MGRWLVVSIGRGDDAGQTRSSRIDCDDPLLMGGARLFSFLSLLLRGPTLASTWQALDLSGVVLGEARSDGRKLPSKLRASLARHVSTLRGVFKRASLRGAGAGRDGRALSAQQFRDVCRTCGLFGPGKKTADAPARPIDAAGVIEATPPTPDYT